MQTVGGSFAGAVFRRTVLANRAPDAPCRAWDRVFTWTALTTDPDVQVVDHGCAERASGTLFADVDALPNCRA